MKKEHLQPINVRSTLKNFLFLRREQIKIREKINPVFIHDLLMDYLEDRRDFGKDYGEYIENMRLTNEVKEDQIREFSQEVDKELEDQGLKEEIKIL